MTESIREGELVLLRGRSGSSTLVRARAGPQTLEGAGVVDLSGAIGAPFGTTLEWAGEPCRVVRPSLADRLGRLHRKAQIITAKDAMALLLLADVGPGERVLEAGAGSGAMTCVLAHAVGEAGRVISYDRRPEFLDVARENVRRAGFDARVEFRLRDVASQGLEALGVHSIVLDLPEPWSVVPSAAAALVPGGSIAVYTPTYNQLERSVHELRAAGFETVRSVELLERALHVGEGGTRPEFEMLGHTGFLTSARWMGGAW